MLQLSHVLNGITVIEIASYIPGPLCTAILAQLGATVVKIERPGGDPMRTLPPLNAAGEHPLFAFLNRSKQFRTLDLRQAADRAVLHDLIRSADVLIDGLRPGALERLGFSDRDLLVTNPRILIVSISGAPNGHPRQYEALHDLNAQALAGILTSGAGVPQTPGVHVADMVSGLMAATNVLAGLLARSLSGRGGRIETSMLTAARWLNAPALTLALAGLQRDDTLNGHLACYRLYKTADERYLAVAALEPHFWQRVCLALERPDLIPLQYERSLQPTLITTLADIFRQRSLHEWMAIFEPLDACVSPVLTPTEAAHDGPLNIWFGYEHQTTASD
jgi:alpha-methylacyl-CoA racemase